MRSTYEKQLRALDRLYAELPTVHCQGRCQEACGPVLMTAPEWQRLRAAHPEAVTVTADLTCPLLDRTSGRCVAFAIRPLVCRLFGALRSRRLACPYGCRASRLLTEVEAGRIRERIRRIASWSGDDSESHGYGRDVLKAIQEIRAR